MEWSGRLLVQSALQGRLGFRRALPHRNRRRGACATGCPTVSGTGRLIRGGGIGACLDNSPVAGAVDVEGVGGFVLAGCFVGAVAERELLGKAAAADEDGFVLRLDFDGAGEVAADESGHGGG